ncbi:unnamed protein product [Adineta steineri]|uniref:G-protein coupled receptors family 1 profile domain-containing protein n=1 Tax=Adineta steineri TaxID=433720 RepID=A0A820DK53_9BILA|nr:unnamed protein product [Adineta steineri]
MLLCGIFGIICAMTFIVIVASHRQFHTLTIMLAFNSAIAGIIVNVTCGCQAIYQLVGDGNDKLCSFRGFLLHAATGLLYQTLCVQALHRLFVVVFATRRYLRSTKVMTSITIFQWLISITFGIPALVIGRIVYQSGSRICQASLTDLTIFLYLAMFIYFCPLTVIVLIYIRIVHFTKQNSFTTNIQHSPADQHRQRRELRFIRRLLIIVSAIFFMSFPYLIFFLRAQFFPHAESLPYAQRVSFVSLSFGFSMWMLLNLIFTDQVRKHLIKTIQALSPRQRPARIQPQNTTVQPLQTTTARITQK